MVRILADHNPSRYREVVRWPIGEFLAAYEAHLIMEARRTYEADVLRWTILAAAGASKSKQPPRLPDLLKD